MSEGPYQLGYPGAQERELLQARVLALAGAPSRSLIREVRTPRRQCGR